MYWERKVAPGALSRPTCNALRSPRRALYVVALLALCLMAVAGCGRSQSAVTQTQDAYQVSFATDPAPANQGAGAVIVTIKDQQGQGIDGARVAIEANMNHAGMKPENAEATTGSGGEYRLPLNWTMGGEWYVDVTITLQNGEVVRRRFPVGVE
ncbi:MAG: FixH family protein [Nitrososphaerales archaeon]